jgi:hypothetical protein
MPVPDDIHPKDLSDAQLETLFRDLTRESGNRGAHRKWREAAATKLSMRADWMRSEMLAAQRAAAESQRVAAEEAAKATYWKKVSAGASVASFLFGIGLKAWLT